MPDLFIPALYGFLGGFARALIGSMKSLRRKEKFRWKYFLFTLIEASLVGMVAGFIYSKDPKVAVAVGYAGTDILEGLYKLRKL